MEAPLAPIHSVRRTSIKDSELITVDDRQTNNKVVKPVFFLYCRPNVLQVNDDVDGGSGGDDDDN